MSIIRLSKPYIIHVSTGVAASMQPRITRAGDIAPQAQGVTSLWTSALLLLVLPMFGQTFHYMLQWPALYYLSKAWPLLMLPLFVRGLFMADAPIRWLFVTFLAYTIGLTPLISMIQFGSDFTDALATTVKIWPFTYYLAFLCLLRILNPTSETVCRVILTLGVATFAIMLLLWVAAPAGWYSFNGIVDKFMLVDSERGYRIYMPMFFGLLFVFYLARRFAQTKEWYVAIAIIICFALLIMIYKQRTTIGAAGLVVIFTACPPKWRRLASAIALAGMAIVFLAVVTSPLLESISTGLGASLLVRLETFSTALTFLNDDGANWLFGLGTVTRFSSVSLGDAVGNDFFFLADIGWAGIIFEYGLIGAAILLGLYVAAYFVARRNSQVLGNAFASALSDYIIFMLISSLIYSLVFVPGEMAVALAVSVYLSTLHHPGYKTTQPDASARPVSLPGIISLHSGHD